MSKFIASFSRQECLDLSFFSELNSIESTVFVEDYF